VSMFVNFIICVNMNIFAFTIREARCMRIKPDETDTDCVFSNDDDVSRKQIKDTCGGGFS
jgi:hypothetical protein